MVFKSDRQRKAVMARLNQPTRSNILSNKKAQLGKRINIVISFLVVVTVLLFLFNDLVPEVRQSGDQFGDTERCAVVGGFFNTTQSLCLNGTNPSDTAIIGFQPIPLSSLFSGNGVVVILIMLFLLITIARLALTSNGNQKR